MSDVQRAGALAVFVVLGGFALASWATGQDNPYTSADETDAAALVLGYIVAAVGVLAVVAAVVAAVLGLRDLPRKVSRR